MTYALRTFFKAHDNDVRALGTMDNYIISGSRDRTAKIFTENGLSYEETSRLTSHENFVSSICALPADNVYLNGAIATGGHDNSIIIHSPFDSVQDKFLIGHQGPVCCVSPGPRAGQLLSSSWDCTAKLWDLHTSSLITSFLGHSEAVWAVLAMPRLGPAPASAQSGFVVTASADKFINVFFTSGAHHLKISGHTDCVRGLAVSESDKFLSCANDGTIRHWNVKTGLCYSTITCHDSYLYSIACVGSIITCSGEGGHVSVWPSGLEKPDEKQIIPVEATSIWAVRILPNGDIATGASDGYIRIYTRVDSRKASSEVMQLYETTFTQDKANLEGGSGSLGVSKGPSKNIYEGQEYDYLFEVDIPDWNMASKLPYNRGEDYHIAAQEFLLKNNLNPSYFESIVKFLQDNTPVPSSVLPRTPRPYPPEKFVVFETHDMDLISRKLKEFMAKMNVPEEEAKTVSSMLKDFAANSVADDKLNDCVDTLLRALMEWKEDMVFPVLDLTRLAVLTERAHPFLCGERHASRLLSALARFAEPNALEVNKMFVFRILSNMYAKPPGEGLLFEKMKDLLPKLMTATSNMTHKGLQLAVSTLAINMSLSAARRKNRELAGQAARLVERVATQIIDSGATFRLLVALGTIGSLSKESLQTTEIVTFLQSVEYKKFSAEVTADHVKLTKCAYLITRDFIASNV